MNPKILNVVWVHPVATSRWQAECQVARSECAVQKNLCGRCERVSEPNVYEAVWGKWGRTTWTPCSFKWSYAETPFQEAIKKNTKYPIYSMAPAHYLWVRVNEAAERKRKRQKKNKKYGKPKANKTNCRHIHTGRAVLVIDCTKAHEQVLGEWSVWHWPLSQHHFYSNKTNNNVYTRS